MQVSWRGLYSSPVQCETEGRSSLQTLVAQKLWHELDADCKAIQKQDECSFSGAYISSSVLLTVSKLVALNVASVYMFLTVSLGIWKTALC